MPGLGGVGEALSPTSRLRRRIALRRNGAELERFRDSVANVFEKRRRRDATATRDEIR